MSVVPFKAPHTLIQGDASMEKKSPPDIDKFIHSKFIYEYCAMAIKRAIANGTYKPKKASGE